ncbi:MAG: hypothetical protein GXY06_07805 [Clostridiaceae bacterium]|nr:hypothetical protein [Clostridiaceae bacterium]
MPYIIYKLMDSLGPLVFGIVLILIIVALHYKQKADKSEFISNRLLRFLKRLHEEQRISDEEYNTLIKGNQPIIPLQTNRAIEADQTVQTSEAIESLPVNKRPTIAPEVSPMTEAVTVSSEAALMTKDSAIAPDVAPTTKAPPLAPPIIPLNTNQTNTRPPIAEKQKSFNAMNILLIVGVLFVILAGAVFATTTWLILPPIVRILTVCSFSGVFFVASVVAEKVLKIPKTAVSFFTLASFFLPISVLAVGFFNLLGDYFSLDGEGRYWIFFAASAVLGVACLIGARRYQFAYFAQACLYCMTAMYIFAIAAFRPEKAVFILLLYVYAIALVLLGQWIRKKGESRLPLEYITRRIPVFAVIHAIVIAMIGLVISGSGVLPGMAAIVFAPFFLTKLFRGKNAYAGTILFAAMLTTGFARLYSGGDLMVTLWMLIASAVILSVVGTLGIFPDTMRKWFSAVTSVIIFLVYLIQFGSLIVRGGWTGLQLIALFVLMVALVFVAYRNKARYILYLVPVLAVTFITGLVYLFAHVTLPHGSLLALLSALFFALCVFSDKKLEFSIRTPISDALFSFWCFIGAAIANTHGWGEGSGQAGLSLIDGTIPLLILLSILVYLMLEKDSSGTSSLSADISAAFIPEIIFLISIPVFIFLKEYMDAVYIFVIFFALMGTFGIWAALNAGRLRLPRALAAGSYVFVLIFGTILIVALSSAGKDTLIPVVAWISVIYLCVILVLKSRNPSILNPSASNAAYSAIAGGAIYLSLLLSAQLWMDLNSGMTTLIFPASAAFIFTVIAMFFAAFDKDLPPAVRHMGRVGFVGLSLFTTLMIGALLISASIFWTPVVYLFVLTVLAYRYVKGVSHRFAWLDMLLIFVTSIICIDKIGHPNIQWAGIIIFSLVFIAALLFGRRMHPRVFSSRIDESFDVRNRTDWPSLMSILFALGLFPLGKYAQWVAFLLLALYALSFVKRTRSKYAERIALTFASFFALVAVWTQPLLDIPDIILLEINLIAFVGFFVLIDRFSWKSKVSKSLVFVSTCISLAIAGLAAMASADIVDALIIGIASFVILIVSFAFKRKQWFILATVTLLVLVLYMTRAFWAMIEWWIYLLLVGLILIGLAAANEISKQKGEKLSSKAKRIFRDWE